MYDYINTVNIPSVPLTELSATLIYSKLNLLKGAQA
jgi:hypothetical protein